MALIVYAAPGKVYRQVIGHVLHWAGRGEYRTLCGRSVELATPGRQFLSVCDECGVVALIEPDGAA